LPIPPETPGSRRIIRARAPIADASPKSTKHHSIAEIDAKPRRYPETVAPGRYIPTKEYPGQATVAYFSPPGANHSGPFDVGGGDRRHPLTDIPASVSLVNGSLGLEGVF
jgi:hypothetical protein